MESEKKFIIEELEEIKGIGLSTRFITNTRKPYKISRGKSHLYKKGMILLISAIFLSIISLSLLTFDPESDPYWHEYILWLPRLVSIVLAIFGILILRKTTSIKPFMIFTKEGIKYKGHLIPWSEIDNIRAKYSAFDDSYFALQIKGQNGSQELDITRVDEFSEDVAVVALRYFDKYGKEKTQERT